MSGRAYTRLSVEDFGRAVIESGDLDPVYIALTKMDWESEAHRHRWLLAYWLFYHPGAASWLSEQPGTKFWEALKAAARNEAEAPVGGRWPRASERRHFRGDKAVVAVGLLATEYTTQTLFEKLIAAAPSYEAVFHAVCQLPQFGPWMAFKVADMLERVLDVPIDFELGALTMFDDPKKAALMVWRDKLGLPDNAVPKDPAKAVSDVVEHLIQTFSDLSAPPSHDRPVGFQEVETVLCKWKSHVNGHYPLDNDLVEIRKGGEPWAAVSTTAAEFLHHLPLPHTSGGDS